MRIIEEFETGNTLEILPVVIEIENEHVLPVLVYRPPGAVGSFMNNLMN